MIHPEIFEGWSRLAEHPELLAAVEHDETVSDALASAAVLRALAGTVDILSIVRELIALGATTSAREVLDATPVPAEGDQPAAGQISAVDRRALFAELQDAGSASRDELHLARAQLEALLRTAQVDVAFYWPGEDDEPDEYLAELERVQAEVARQIEARARQLDARMDESWSAERIAVVSGAIRGRRLRDAERLMGAPDDAAARWPAVPAAQACDPAQIRPLGVWPWDARLDEVLGWLDRGPRLTLPPLGFAATFATPLAGRSAEMLDALQRASGADRSQVQEAMLQAAACGLDARIERGPDPVLVLEDAVLAVVPALRRLAVSAESSTSTSVTLRLAASAAEVTLTEADLLAAAGAGALHRPRLLRVLGTQLDLELAPLGLAAPPGDDPELLLAWGIWLLGVGPDDQAIALAHALGADRWDVTSRLLNATLGAHQRGTVLSAGAVAAAWRSPAFDRQLQAWLLALLSGDVGERALLEGIVEVDEDDASLELLADLSHANVSNASEEHVTTAARSLAAARLVWLADDGMLRCPSPMRAVLRKALGL